MPKICTCPVPSAIASIITATPCPQQFGQTQKVFFVRKGQTIASVASLITEAVFDALLITTDDTKMVASPIMGNPVFEPGAIKEFGTGNEVQNGIPINMGSDMTKFTARIYDNPQTIITLMKELGCEDLEVYFVNGNGFWGHSMSTSTAIKGFDVYQVFVGDKKVGGYDEPDVNEVQFYLPPNWSDDFTITDPTDNYNPLTKFNA